MRRILFVMAVAMLMIPMGIFGQTYQALWRQVEEAQNKDLPQTAMTHLKKIEKKAEQERAYGQLLKSTLLHARLQSEVAPDSLRPAVDRLEQIESVTQDLPLKAVYDAVLSKVYQQNRSLADDWEKRSTDYAAQAMAHPEVLAGVKADLYEPFVVKGKDSEVFGNDLLSVIGVELDAWEWMRQYYERVGNRRALCQLALRLADDIKTLDSLAVLYGDLPEAQVIAKKRQNLWTVMTNPQFHFYMSQRVAMPDESQTIQLHQLRNIRQLTVRVYRTRLKGDTELNANDAKDLAKIRVGIKEMTSHSQTKTYSQHAPTELYDDSLVLNGLPAGVYLIECGSPKIDTARELLFVSGLRVMTQPMPDHQMRYVVVDAHSGQPVGKAKLRMIYQTGWNSPKKVEEHTCNNQGELILRQANRRPQEVFAYTATDDYSPSVNAYGQYSYYERQYGAEHISLFTDRSIYRPGQMVHVAAIVWKEQSAIDHTAVADKVMRMELRDANYKLVAEQQVTTDRFGKCSAQFTLPAGLLNGRFTVRVNNASVSFNVEEYKRPTFQVEFKEYRQPYRQGDTVRVQGKTVSYAGVPVQGAKVKYTVRRRVAFWWMSYSWYWKSGYSGRGLQDEVVSEGETTTADDGTFAVEMPMVLPGDLGHRTMFYHFVVEADVTDMGGETHHGVMTLPLGTRSTALTCDLPLQVRRDQMPEVTFTRRNAAGQEIGGTVKYRIDEGKWQETAANLQCSIFNASCKSGKHRLQAVCEQDTVDIQFVVFSLDDKVPAGETHDWFYVSHQQFPNDGSPVTLQVGASDPDLHIVYGIFAGGKVIESGSAERNAALVNRQFTYKKEYGSGLLLTYAWVKEGQCHRHTAIITRPMPDQQLKLQWTTFRDRLIPGQQEEWRLQIQNPDGTPAEASLMAVLYDKSLDQIKAHHWDFVPGNYLSKPSTSWQWRMWGGIGLSGAYNYKLAQERGFSYSHFDSSVYPYYYAPIRIRGMGRVMMAKAATGAVMESKSIGTFDVQSNDAAAVPEESVVVGYAVREDEASEKPRQDEIPLRENMDETAFCYPALETDSEGRVVLKFTLPESLTTWRFMGIANTTQMLYGSIGGETVAQKQLMVQPNMPRFIREGDETMLTTRITNVGEKTLKGEASLRLQDAESVGELLNLSEPFEAEAGKTVTVTFRIPAHVLRPSLLICKIGALGSTAESECFSDGEQHYLPVLSNREWVTRTVPYTQHKPGVKTINLSTLFPQGTSQHKLTVEYTNNPVWLMVQALPVLGQPWEHSAIEQAASYYSNLLAKTLLAQTPQVKTTFEQWKRENSQLSTLNSQLDKNQELKDLTLSETPWVGAADRESEQKQRLADFFDANGINMRLQTAVSKLQQLQHADGSFSWYPGMQGSLSITTAVVEMLVRLNVMAGEQQDIRQMQTRAFNYIGKEMVRLVDEMKRDEKKGRKPSFPSFTALRWLYLCALDGRQLETSVNTANNYLIALLKKDIKRQTIYEKALSAIVLAKHGESKRALEYVRSLKEYTVYTEETGRYFDAPRAAYSWFDYKIPTEVAAIEAIQSVTPQDTQTVEEMRRWLLQEKRTQAWDTPVNSVNAIWAFLNENSTLLTNNEQTQLAIDGKPLDLPQATAGIGYVKTAVNAPQGKTFTATKTGEGTSWGALYAQFFQHTSDIEASKSGISVKRELLTANDTLTIGQRVKVRITIQTTRDLDFVQLADRRAACMEPVQQLSGYRNGAYVEPKDAATHYFFHQLPKGKHVVETEYYIDRAGVYQTGTCTVGCAYAPEYRATAPALNIFVK